jgi:hypothetical protein
LKGFRRTFFRFDKLHALLIGFSLIVDDCGCGNRPYRDGKDGSPTRLKMSAPGTRRAPARHDQARAHDLDVDQGR